MAFTVGSHGDFVRTDAIQRARHAKRAGEITSDERTAIEDAEIAALLEKQRELGVTIISDGGFRHGDYRGTILESVAGLRRVPDARTSSGLVVWTAEAELTRKTPIAAPGARFLRAQTDGPISVTLPSPAHLAARMFSAASEAAYPTAVHLGTAFARIISTEIAELAALGVDVIELVNPDFDRHLLEAPAGALRFAEALHLDASVLDVPRADTALALTVGWGSHVDAPVDAERVTALFGAGFDQINIPFHCDAAVAQEVLRFAPEDVTVGLGLVDATTRQQLPDVLARLEAAAARHDDLVLLPNRGFHPVHYVPAPLTIAEQDAQLALLAQAARTFEGVSA